jgi:ferredoxin
VVSGPGAAWRLSVDADTCIGSGMCAGVAPALFTLVHGVSVPDPGPIAPDPAAVDAAEFCPVEAITIRDAADDHLVAPRP